MTGASGAPPDRALIVFARAPSAPGKTRLTATLSSDRARALREALLLDTLDAVRAAHVPLVIAFTPDDAGDEMSLLAPGITLVRQHGADLGERMQHALDEVLNVGTGMVALVGSDLPTLPASHVSDAFAMCDSDADMVLGPTEDGGFYLLAARRRVTPVLGGIDWSAPAVRGRVVEAALGAGLTVGVGPSWWDVDTRADLQRVVRDGNRDMARRTKLLAATALTEPPTDRRE